jgi:hypothetical protein
MTSTRPDISSTIFIQSSREMHELSSSMLLIKVIESEEKVKYITFLTLYLENVA